MKFAFLIAFAFFAFSGCSTGLKKVSQAVKIIKSEPKNCQDLGEVLGSGGAMWGTTEGNVQSARNDIRNKAADLGANTVVLETNNQGAGNVVTLSGHAYKCP